jgi:transposase
MIVLIKNTKRINIRPKECKGCPLANEGICQKIYKVKISTDLRKYTSPVQGSKAWKTIFKHRTAVERVNSYLKLYFQLDNLRYRTEKRAEVHFDLEPSFLMLQN